MSERKYNSDTGKYEVVNLWANAPIQGIRVLAPGGRDAWVLSPAGRAARNDDGSWSQYAAMRDPEKDIQTLVRGGWAFPDFDGAPEGLRLYYKSSTGWRADVILCDGTFAPRGMDGTWHPSPFGDPVTVAKRIAWYREAWDVILVDEEPSERVYWNEWKAERPAIRPGDVIRDTRTGATWFLDFGHKEGTWKQVGNSDLLAPVIMRNSEFKIPDQYKILSRAAQ